MLPLRHSCQAFPQPIFPPAGRAKSPLWPVAACLHEARIVCFLQAVLNDQCNAVDSLNHEILIQNLDPVRPPRRQLLAALPAEPSVSSGGRKITFPGAFPLWLKALSYAGVFTLMPKASEISSRTAFSGSLTATPCSFAASATFCPIASAHFL